MRCEQRSSAPNGCSSVGLQPDAVACMKFTSLKTEERPNHSCAAWLSPINSSFRFVGSDFMQSFVTNFAWGFREGRKQLPTRYCASVVASAFSRKEAIRTAWVEYRDGNPRVTIALNPKTAKAAAETDAI